MTRKDYQLIASTIKYRREMTQGTFYSLALKDVAKDLASNLELDNDRFDRKRFLEACGVSS